MKHSMKHSMKRGIQFLTQLLIATLVVGVFLAAAFAASPSMNSHEAFLIANNVTSDEERGRLATQELALVTAIKALTEKMIFISLSSNAPLKVATVKNKPWLTPYLSTAAWKGINASIGDLTRHFNSNKKITRAQGVSIIMLALMNKNDVYQKFKTLPDPYVDIHKSPHRAVIKAAYQQNIYRVEGRRFRPKKLMERREFLEAIYRAIVQKQKMATLAVSSQLLAQADAPTSDVWDQEFDLLPEPFGEDDVAENLSSQEQDARPDLTITSVDLKRGHASFGDSLAVEVRNIGDKSTNVNFGVFDRPDWYNYKGQFLI